MHRKFLILLTVLFLGLLASNVYAQQHVCEEETTIYLFWGNGCPHCEKERIFLDELQKQHTGLRVKYYEVWYNAENQQKYREFADAYGTYNGSEVPRLFVGDRVFLGFDEIGADLIYLESRKAYLGSKNQIEKAIEECTTNGCVSPEEIVYGDENATHGDTDGNFTINLPFFGNVSVKEWSLPALTIVLGIIDGFNPCAMWVLVYLISVLVVTRERKKIWFIVGTFVLASGILYFLFMTIWLNLFLTIGSIWIINILIGLIALGSGIYHLKKYVMKEAEECAIGDIEKKRRTMDRINKLVKPALLPATILGIIFLAFSVNLIEFVCSAGIPAVFTKILTMSNLSAMEYYMYILLYDVFFMLDDLLIFGAAAITLQYLNISGKYVRWVTLIGGIIMVLLGIALIFFPQLLMFAA